MRFTEEFRTHVRAAALLSLALAWGPAPVAAQTCGITNDDNNLSGVVNTYFPGVGTVAAGASGITIDTSAFGGVNQGIAAGDLLLVIQMQDADINASNGVSYGDGATGRGQTAINRSGLYEYVVAQSAAAVNSGNQTVSITGGGAANGTINSYRTAASTTTTGQRTFQVMRVARFRNVTLNGVTALSWNGRIGGVVAIDAAATVTLSANSVDVTGQGFRGGIGQARNGAAGLASTDYRRPAGAAAHGLKAEGIAGTPTGLTGVGATTGYPTDVAADVNGDRARGAPGNAGGGGTDGNGASNDRNTGGGGGSNAGAGGQGGNAWFSNLASGGLGGVAFPSTFARAVLGGGGGAGTRNNSTGVQSGGSAGGGIVFIRAAGVAGTGTITADGATANTPTLTPANDGGGGGGAGGSVIFVAPTGVSLANLTVLARGGRGSDAWPTQAPGATFPGERHGPGGGGGGGSYFLSGVPAATSSVAGGANGITTTANDAYGATPGTSGAIDVAVSFDSIPGVQTCFAVTRASILGVRVTPGLVEFATDTQRQTLGFNVFAVTGRGRRTKLNGDLVRAAQPNSFGPSVYRVEIPSILVDSLSIEEIDTFGRSRLMGPFEASDAGLARAFVRAERRTRLETQRVQAARRAGLGGRLEHTPPDRRGVMPSIYSLPEGIKVRVSQPGIVRIPLAEAANFGLPMPPASRLQVYNLGRAVPHEIVADAIQFRAVSLGTDYTGENVYLIRWTGAPPQPAVSLTRSGFPLVSGHTRIERNVLFAPFVPEGLDPWIWDVVTSGAPVSTFPFDLASLGGVPNTASVRIGLIGASDHVHHVTATINGFFVGTLDFAGADGAVLEGAIPGAVLRPAANELQLTYSVDGESPDQGLVLLDTVDLGVTLGPVEAAAAYKLEPYAPSLPRLRAADYLIVSHPEFLAQARRLAMAKRGEGLRPIVVDVTTAYDRFSAGVVEAAAIRELIRRVASVAPLRHVLLLGGDTYDPRDFTGAGLRSFVPSLHGRDDVFGRVPSENRYADLDGDARPDVAIGRLPARSAADADVLVDKVARQSASLSSTSGRHVVAFDNSAPGDYPFAGHAASVISRVPGVATVADLRAGIDAARSALIGGLLQGAQTTHYMGHAGHTQWADEGLLRTSDAASLATATPTVLFTWACEAQWFQNDTPTVNEALLLVPRGGALAASGPVGISDPAKQRALADRVYTRFFTGHTLGEALRLAKRELLDADPGAASVIDGWSLLGDPALSLLPR